MQLDTLYDVRWALIMQTITGWLTVLDKIKHNAPNQIVMGSAICFLLICRRFDLRPSNVLDIAGRVIDRSRTVSPQVVAGFEAYLKNEVSSE